MSVAERDRAAWEAIRTWPAHAGIDVVREGLDYAELTRQFLWDKVGRAIRCVIDPAEGSFERSLLENATSAPEPKPASPGPIGRLRARCGQLFANLSSVYSLKSASLGRRQRSVFLPHPLWHLERAAAALIESGSVAVVANSARPGYAGAHSFPTPLRIRPADHTYGKPLHQGILQGLSKLGVPLLPRDAKRLGDQIHQLMVNVRIAEAELRTVRPSAILLPGDNHPPFQAYVLLARRQGVPTIMLQHGLDCERFYLDEAYASAIAVWGKARLDRYTNDSDRQPRRLEVTGNPAHDALPPPTEWTRAGITGSGSRARTIPRSATPPRVRRGRDCSSWSR